MQRSAQRDYDEAALRRLLDQAQVEIVNGSPVEVRAAVDLPAGHLDPWVLRMAQERKAATPPGSARSRLRSGLGLFAAKERRLLEGRAALAAYMETDAYDRDVTSGSVEVSRETWQLAGEARTVWRYARVLEGSAPRPAFLHLHGGGFSAGTPNGRDPFLRVVADRSDAVVFDLDYSMLPERTFPQPVLEATAALAHLHRNASAWQLDPARLCIGGGSAGGNIAAAAALMARDRGYPPVALQVLYSPFLTFTGTQPGLVFKAVEVVPEHRALAGPQSFRVLGLLMRLLARSYRGDGRRDDPYMSPALATSFAGLAPALIITGEMDPLHQPAEHFAGDLARAGVPVRTIRYRGCQHESVVQVGRVPQGEAVALETAAALERTGHAA